VSFEVVNGSFFMLLYEGRRLKELSLIYSAKKGFSALLLQWPIYQIMDFRKLAGRMGCLEVGLSRLTERRFTPTRAGGAPGAVVPAKGWVAAGAGGASDGRPTTIRPKRSRRAREVPRKKPLASRPYLRAACTTTTRWTNDKQVDK